MSAVMTCRACTRCQAITDHVCLLQAAGKRRRLSAAGTARLSSRRRLQQGAGTAQAMVCSVRQYLPPGAQPPAACPAVAASSSSSPQLGFIPVAIPVVFHCECSAALAQPHLLSCCLLRGSCEHVTYCLHVLGYSVLLCHLQWLPRLVHALSC